MADAQERLVVELEARINQFEKNFAKAPRIANDNWNKVEARGSRAAKRMEGDAASAVARVNRQLQSIGGNFDLGLSGAVRNGLAGVATAFSIDQVRKLADTWTAAGSSIAAAGVAQERVGSTTVEISRIAERSRTDFSATSELYARLTRSSQALGASQAEVAVATEIVAKGLKLSGASAAEAQGAMIQLSQALQSGRLGGDELRSLLEGAPLLAQAIAREFKVSIGELKDLGASGQLTADRVFRAIVASAGDVEKAFAKMRPTVADSFKALETAALRYVGTSSTVAAATNALSSLLGGVGKNFDTIATGAIALGAVIATRLIAVGIAPLALSLGAVTAQSIIAVPALTAVNAALAVGVLQARAGAIAFAGVSRALALVGGPVGAAILGVGAAALYFSSHADEAADRAKAYAAALEEIRAKAGPTARAIDETTDAVIRAAKAQADEQASNLRRGIVEADGDIAKFKAQVAQLLNEYALLARRTPEVSNQLRSLAQGFDGSAESATKLKAELFALANANPNFENIAAKLGPLLDGLAGAIARVAQLRSSLAGLPGAVATATEKAISAKIPNPTAGTSYDQDAGAVSNDPVIRDLQGQGQLQRATADAEMDETVKKIRDTKAKLRKEILDGGGTVDPAALDLAARRIVAADASGKGGGGSSAEKKNDFTREEASLVRRVRGLNAEAEAVGRSAFEAAKAESSFRLLDAAKQAGIPITDALRAKVDQLSASYATAKVRLDEAQRAQRDMQQAGQFFGSQLSDGIASLAFEGGKLVDVFRNVAVAIGKAAIQAALLGSGPLAAFTGGSPANGAMGGIFGAFLGGFGGGSNFAADLIGFNPFGGYAEGGRIRGPGTGTSDSVPIMASDGEFMVNAAATQRHLPLLEAINSGRVPHLAAGGMVGSSPFPALSAANSNSTVSIAPTINVSVAGSGGTPAQNDDLAAKVGAQITRELEALVDRRMMAQMRPGAMLHAAAGRR